MQWKWFKVRVAKCDPIYFKLILIWFGSVVLLVGLWAYLSVFINNYRAFQCHHGHLAVGWQHRNLPIWLALSYQSLLVNSMRVAHHGAECHFHDNIVALPIFVAYSGCKMKQLLSLISYSNRKTTIFKATNISNERAILMLQSQQQIIFAHEKWQTNISFGTASTLRHGMPGMHGRMAESNRGHCCDRNIWLEMYVNHS